MPRPAPRTPPCATCRPFPVITPGNAAALLLGTLLAVVAVLLLAPSPADAAGERPRGPSLVIIGGALEPGNTPVYEAILERRLPGRPICVLPMASVEPRTSMESYLADFEAVGGPAAAVGILLTVDEPTKATEPQVLRRLEKECGGFFFTGGDQSRIVDLLRPNGDQTAASRAILRVHRAGGVVAGTSAGAAMMSDPMIGAGSSADALEHGAVDRDGEPGVWLRNGMGYLEEALVDQHFLARGRLGRLLVALHTENRTLGLGVDENTALVVDGLSSARPGGPRPVATVIGTSGVLVVDARPTDADRRERVEPGEPLRWRLWLLADGDIFHFHERRAEPSPHHRPITTLGDARDRLRHPFEDDALHQTLVELARSVDASVRLGRRSDGLELGKGPDFRAFEVAVDGAEVDDAEESPPHPISAGPYLITWSPPTATDG